MDIKNIIDETVRIVAVVSPELVKAVEQIRQTITSDGAAKMVGVKHFVLVAISFLNRNGKMLQQSL